MALRLREDPRVAAARRGRRRLCTPPSATQHPGKQQRGPRAEHRGVGSGRGRKVGVHARLRLGTGRVLAQVCPASRGC